MIKSMYSSATGMLAQEQRLDVIGGNIANANTDGYRRDAVTLRSFNEELVSRLPDDAAVGSLSTGAEVASVRADLSQSGLQSTGLTTDLAAEGDGFFAVDTGGTVAYTRDGSLHLDTQGYLALSGGQRLLGENGQPVYVGTDRFTVSSDGTVTAGAATAGRIRLYASAQADGTVRQADGFFTLANPQTTNAAVRQGYLEDSNVDVAQEMTTMMAATRSFGTCQQAFKTADDTLDQLLQAGSLRS